MGMAKILVNNEYPYSKRTPPIVNSSVAIRHSGMNDVACSRLTSARPLVTLASTADVLAITAYVDRYLAKGIMSHTACRSFTYSAIIEVSIDTGKGTRYASLNTAYANWR